MMRPGPLSGRPILDLAKCALLATLAISSCAGTSPYCPNLPSPLLNVCSSEQIDTCHLSFTSDLEDFYTCTTLPPRGHRLWTDSHASFRFSNYSYRSDLDPRTEIVAQLLQGTTRGSVSGRLDLDGALARELFRAVAAIEKIVSDKAILLNGGLRQRTMHCINLDVWAALAVLNETFGENPPVYEMRKLSMENASDEDNIPMHVPDHVKEVHTELVFAVSPLLDISAVDNAVQTMFPDSFCRLSTPESTSTPGLKILRQDPNAFTSMKSLAELRSHYHRDEARHQPTDNTWLRYDPQSIHAELWRFVVLPQDYSELCFEPLGVDYVYEVVEYNRRRGIARVERTWTVKYSSFAMSEEEMDEMFWRGTRLVGWDDGP